MLPSQIPLALPRPTRVRQRSQRRPFTPSPAPGRYCLPREVHDRLVPTLASYRNRDAAFALATFLGRFWSMPSRIDGSFPIDRCALAGRPDLGLTEKQIRNAIRVLEEVGFIDRALTSGSKYKATPDGLRRKPIQFTFGTDYTPMFVFANKRATAARERRIGERRTNPTKGAQRASVAISGAFSSKGPEIKNPSERSVIIGPLLKEGSLPPLTFDSTSSVDAALARLWQGFRHCRGG